jgi:ribose transport system ATP-binding protein
MAACHLVTPNDVSREPRSRGRDMPLLETRGLSKRFAGVVALDEVDFEADAGEVRAIVGANGAGKSTFMNILAGVFPPSSGEIRFAGRLVSVASPRAAHELGISIVFQEFSSTAELTVAENIFLGREPITRVRADRS